MYNTRYSFLLSSLACTLVVIGWNTQVIGQETTKKTKEPVYRIGLAPKNDTNSGPIESTDTTAESNNVSNASTKTTAALAPIDKALNIAYEGLDMIHRDIRDYEAILVKRERIDGKLGDPEFMTAKIRNRRPKDGVPLSIYFRFLKPRAYKDREVIWVEGRNDGKLIAHEGSGLLKNIRGVLDPDGHMAMKGNRYPIYEAGIENLVVRLIEKGERDRKLGESVVEFFEDTKINGRTCTMIQVTHPENKEPYDFHICRIFIDDELQVPIRYAGYSWPLTPGGKPVLEEEYTYLKMKLNVGLSDDDFNPDNPKYDYPN